MNAFVMLLIKGNLDLTLIDTLIAEGANVDEVFRGGNTALHYAAQCGHAGVVESLLARKANIDMLNEIGLTAFVRACCDGKEKVVEAFLRNGRVDLNNILNNGYTALHHVAVTGKTEVVNLLLDNQAKTDVLDKNGFTAFVVACFYGQEKVVETFLKKEVDF